MRIEDLPVSQFIAALHDKYSTDFEGRIADYIPELARANPNHFSIAIATVDGHVYQAGDLGQAFTIQSVSKPIVYGLALEDRGLAHVFERIGVEPSGDPFNSITFDERNNRPFNPMVNAGAIAAAALVKGDGIEERFGHVTAMFEKFMGRKPALDERVYISERDTGNRNRAITYLALNAGMIDGDVIEHLDLYFRQCSLLVTARDLAIAAATLANDGANPISNQRALKREHVRAVLSVMSSCGMYDYAGEWQFNVGLPAKSGVSGGIMAVLPGQVGIGVYSPLVDDVGNSMRGLKVCHDLSRTFRLHMLEQRGAARTAIRRTYDASETGSIRVRHPRDRMRLDELGTQIAVLELQGDLLFAEAEKVSRHVLKGRDGTKFFVLDFRRLFRIDAVGFEILAALDRTLKASGQHLIIAGARSNIMAGSRGKFPTPDDETAQPVPRWFATVDAALEYLEDHLLGAEPPASLRPGTVGIDGFEILQNLTCAERTTLMAFLHARPFSEGETLVEIGTPSDGLYFVVSGRVDVTVPLDSAHADYRVNTIDEGNVFGELAIFESQARTANVVAATGGEVLILSPEDLKNLFDNEPDIYRQLVMAVGRSLAERLRRATEEIRALAR